MKDTRSASQILYGFLPEQTVDVKSGIWKVRKWHTHAAHGVDQDELVQALIRRSRPWEAEGRDGDFVSHLRSGRTVRVEALDREKGILMTAFPRTWKCHNCNRLHAKPNAKCKCGNTRHGQLPFVLFHDACGQIQEPYYPRCRIHNDVRIVLPGTTNLYEIKLTCPECKQQLSQAFLHTKCNCGLQGRRGEEMEFNVHRGASVYTPRGITVVNPPSKKQMRRLENAGGPTSAAIWVATGMESDWVEGIEGGKAAALRRTLSESGLDSETVERMMQEAKLTDADHSEVKGPADVIEKLETESVALALAMSESRQTIAQLREAALDSAIRLYSETYPDALSEAGLERIDLAERFPVLIGQYGYTRGDHEPGKSRLRTFSKDGDYIVYGEISTTEALVLRLDPQRVGRWLRHIGFEVNDFSDSKTAFEALLETMGSGPEAFRAVEKIETLIHSLSHRMVRQTSFYAGIDRNGLSELLFPTALAFVCFAAPRGDFVLGGLQAMFEHDLHTVLHRLVHDEHRCALDPGCASNPNGAACAVCLHLGEPSCQLFNTKLDRKILFGREGYFSFEPK